MSTSKILQLVTHDTSPPLLLGWPGDLATGENLTIRFSFAIFLPETVLIHDPVWVACLNRCPPAFE